VPWSSRKVSAVHNSDIHFELRLVYTIHQPVLVNATQLPGPVAMGTRLSYKVGA